MLKGDFQLFSNIRDSKGQVKLSIHAVSTDVCYEDARDIPDLQISVEHDKSVYSGPGKQQLFRLPYQMKETDETSILKMCVKQDEWVELDYDDVEMEDLFIQNIGGCELVKHEEEIKHVPVSIPEEEPESDAVRGFANLLSDDRFNNMKKWMKMMRLFKNLNCPKLFDRLSSKYDNYRPGEVDKFMAKPDTGLRTLGMGTLRYWAREDSPDMYEAVANQYKPPKQSKQQLLNYYINQPVIRDEIKSIRHESKYCDKSVFGLEGVVFVKAPQGSGKTYGAMQYIADECKKNQDTTVVFNSFRISLADKYKSDMDEYDVDMKHYQEKEDGKQIILDDSVKRIVLQMDSYSRLKWTSPPDIFVIDELSQVRTHIVSTTYLRQKKSNMNWAKFEWCIKYSKKIICLDAGLMKKDIDWLRYIRGKDDTNVCENVYRPDNGEIEIIEDTHETLLRIKEELKTGKVYVACNSSKKVMEAYADYLECKNMIMINSSTIGHKNVKECLKDITQLEKYDLVMVSPSIQSGVSFNKREVFSVFGIYDNRTTSSKNTVQMNRRIRFPKKIYNNIKQTDNNIPFWEEKDIVRKITMENEHIFKQDKESLGQNTNISISINGTTELKNNHIIDHWAKVKYEGYCDKRYYVRNTINSLKVEGYIVKLCECDDSTERVEQRKLLKKLIKLIKEQNEQTHNKELHETKITKRKKDLEELTIRTDDEQNQLNKQYILDGYNKIEPSNPGWYDIYNKQPIINSFKANKKIIEYKTNKEAIEGIKESEFNTVVESKNYDKYKGSDVIIKKKKYRKYEILLNMVDMFGFQSIYDDREIKRDDIVNSLEKIKNKYFTDDMKDSCLILNKRVKRVAESINGNMRSQLICINGALNEFGISLKSKGREKTIYYIKHKYKDMFHYDNDTPAPIDIPNLRDSGHEEYVEPYTPEETSAAIDALVL
jgi:hypothetical protein